MLVEHEGARNCTRWTLEHGSARRQKTKISKFKGDFGARWSRWACVEEASWRLTMHLLVILVAWVRCMMTVEHDGRHSCTRWTPEHGSATRRKSKISKFRWILVQKLPLFWFHIFDPKQKEQFFFVLLHDIGHRFLLFSSY